MVAWAGAWLAACEWTCCYAARVGSPVPPPPAHHTHIRWTNNTKAHRNVLMALAHDEQDVDVAVAAYSVPAQAVHVSVDASAYLWPAAQAVHVVASLHVSQLLIAVVQVAGVPEFR